MRKAQKIGLKKLERWHRDVEKERREHPTLPNRAVEQIVRDHRSVVAKKRLRHRDSTLYRW
jgi:hypothetical protein